MWIYLFLFLSFLQVSLLGIGGYASAQALLEHEVVTLHHWLTPEQMGNLMAFCRMLPGGTGLNTATLTGALAASAQFGVWGCIASAVLSVLALVLPSALWTAVFVRLQERRKYKTFYDCAMTVLRPLVPGLVAAAAILMMRGDNFGTPSTTPWDFWVSVFLFFATLIGVGVYRFNALFMVVLCGVAGWMLL